MNIHGSSRMEVFINSPWSTGSQAYMTASENEASGISGQLTWPWPPAVQLAVGGGHRTVLHCGCQRRDKAQTDKGCAGFYLRG